MTGKLFWGIIGYSAVHQRSTATTISKESDITTGKHLGSRDHDEFLIPPFPLSTCMLEQKHYSYYDAHSTAPAVVASLRAYIH